MIQGLARFDILAGEPMRDPDYAASDSGLRRVGSRLDVGEESLGVRPHRRQLAAHVTSGPQAIVGRQAFVRVLVAKRHLAGPCKGFGRFARPVAARGDQRVAVSDVQRAPLARFTHRLVGHGDRLAEMGDRLLEGRAAKGLIARPAPPFDGLVVETRFREMMGDDFRLGRGAVRLIAQEFGCAAVQRLSAALEQAVVGRVLDQRVLEAIVRLMARALGDEEVRVSESIEGGLERGRQFHPKRAIAHR